MLHFMHCLLLFCIANKCITHCCYAFLALRFMYFLFSDICTAEHCTTCGTATACDGCTQGYTMVDADFDNTTETCECKICVHSLCIAELLIKMILGNTIYAFAMIIQ